MADDSILQIQHNTKSSVNVFYQNVRGLNSKAGEILENAVSLDIPIFVSLTFLTPGDFYTDYFLDSFNGDFLVMEGLGLQVLPSGFCYAMWPRGRFNGGFREPVYIAIPGRQEHL